MTITVDAASEADAIKQLEKRCDVLPWKPDPNEHGEVDYHCNRDEIIVIGDANEIDAFKANPNLPLEGTP
jgi:phosphoglycolate phosphatase-like HAD superfamily hydrolase